MEKTRNSSAWLEEGYNLFAKEGLEGIQIERLARILQLNKSGFYHYFGDLEGFCVGLLNLHKEKLDLFIDGIGKVKNLDPEYLQLLTEHADLVMFQVQLTRNKENRSFYKASEAVDQRVNLALRQLWSDYMEIQNDPELALRYFDMVRDMFYTRISYQNLNYHFLHNLATEAKRVIDEIWKTKDQVDAKSSV